MKTKLGLGSLAIAVLSAHSTVLAASESINPFQRGGLHLGGVYQRTMSQQDNVKNPSGFAFGFHGSALKGNFGMSVNLDLQSMSSSANTLVSAQILPIVQVGKIYFGLGIGGGAWGPLDSHFIRGDDDENEDSIIDIDAGGSGVDNRAYGWLGAGALGVLLGPIQIELRPQVDLRKSKPLKNTFWFLSVGYNAQFRPQK